MKLSRLLLAAALVASWTALPLSAWAEYGGKDEDEEMSIRKRAGHEGRGEDGYERQRHDGPRGRNDADPKMKEMFEKTRELNQKVRELSKKMRQGPDSEKASAKVEARKALGELFDAKLAMNAAMLQKMEKHAAELRANIEKKKASREKAIESRLARMADENDDWD